MSVKDFFSLGVVFLVSFFLSFFLGLFSGAGFLTLIIRGFLSSLMMTVIAGVIWFIIRNYFPEVYSVFSGDKKEETLEVSSSTLSDNSSFIHEEDPTKKTLPEEDVPSDKSEKKEDISFNNVWDENKEKIKEPTFADLEKEIGWSKASENSEGLEKVSKERFSSQDPQTMAQTIRHILVDDKKP